MGNDKTYTARLYTELPTLRKGQVRLQPQPVPQGQEGPGSIQQGPNPTPWHQPASWESSAMNSEHLSPGQPWPPIPEQVLSERLRGGGTPPHSVLRNQWGEKAALKIPRCPYLLDFPSEVQAFHFGLHSTFGARMVPCTTGVDGGCSRISPCPAHGGNRVVGSHQFQLCLRTDQQFHTAAPTGFNYRAFFSGQDSTREQHSSQKQRQALSQKIL